MRPLSFLFFFKFLFLFLFIYLFMAVLGLYFTDNVLRPSCWSPASEGRQTCLLQEE